MIQIILSILKNINDILNTKYCFKDIIGHLSEYSTKTSEYAFEKDFSYMFIKSLDT